MTTDPQPSTPADTARTTRPLKITDVQGLRGALGYEDPAAISPDSALVAFTIRSFGQRPDNAAAERGVPSRAAWALNWPSPKWTVARGARSPPAGTVAGHRGGRPMAVGWRSTPDRNGIAQVWLWDRETNETRLACADPIQISHEFEVLPVVAGQLSAGGQAADSPVGSRSHDASRRRRRARARSGYRRRKRHRPLLRRREPALV